MKKYLTTTLALLGLAGSAYAAFPLPLSRLMPETHRIPFIRPVAPVLSLLTLLLLGLTPIRGQASLPSTTGLQLTGIAAAPLGGFWVQRHDGGTRGETLFLSGAPHLGNTPNGGSIAAIPDRNGYWIVTIGGDIFSRGEATELCGWRLTDCSGFPLLTMFWQTVVGAAAMPGGRGFWAVSRDGKVWTAGDAQFYGDVRNDSNVPTGIVATPSGKGYYIVLEDGGVYSFGDAVFFGSTGGKKPGGHHVTGMALSIGDDGKVNGYWLIAEDGAVYTFGSAPFWGNAGITDWKVTSIVSFPAPVPGQPPQRTRGYAWVFNNGEVRAVYGPLGEPSAK
jgi:hypothetical protein